MLVIRATIPTLELDKVFEQKTEIAKTVGERLEKVLVSTTSTFKQNKQKKLNQFISDFPCGIT